MIIYFLGTNFIKCPLRTLDLKCVSSHYPKLEALCQTYIVIKQQHSDLLLIIDFAGQADLKLSFTDSEVTTTLSNRTATVNSFYLNAYTSIRIRGLVSKEPVVLCWWQVEPNVWFIYRVDY